MNNYLNSYWERLADSSLCELVELFGDKIHWPELPSDHQYRNRLFNQWRILWLCIGQVLSHSQTSVESLRKAQVWLWSKKKGFIQYGSIL